MFEAASFHGEKMKGEPQQHSRTAGIYPRRRARAKANGRLEMLMAERRLRGETNQTKCREVKSLCHLRERNCRRTFSGANIAI